MLVDDNPEFLRSAERFLRHQPGFEIVESARSGSQALWKVRTDHIDVVVLDMVMPGINGLEITRVLKTMQFPPKIIVHSFLNAEEYRSRALASGADAFVGKDAFVERVTGIIAALCGGGGTHPG